MDRSDSKSDYLNDNPHGCDERLAPIKLKKVCSRVGKFLRQPLCNEQKIRAGSNSLLKERQDFSVRKSQGRFRFDEARTSKHRQNGFEQAAFRSIEVDHPEAHQGPFPPLLERAHRKS